jgi:hypothetical protein
MTQIPDRRQHQPWQHQWEGGAVWDTCVNQEVEDRGLHYGRVYLSSPLGEF